MNRDRSYYRKMRAKHILRKRKIAAQSSNWFYSCDGKFSKGKVHCSCAFCSPKTRNKGYRRYRYGNYNPSLFYKSSDLKKIQHMKDDYVDFLKNL